MFEIIGALLVCLWVADFITGVVHWAEDTYCEDGYPIIGKLICEPNRLHHIDPNLMVRTGTFISRNILQWVSALCAFGLLYLADYANIYTFMTLLFASFGNEVHRWNHMSKTGPVISFIKQSGYIQSQKQHSLHHKPPHETNYCILTSQVNPVLEAINFWRSIEFIIRVTTGLEPKAKQ